MAYSGSIGILLTYPDGASVTDSPASATQLATGKFAKTEMVGLDADGRLAEIIIEKAKRWGKAAVLVSAQTRFMQLSSNRRETVTKAQHNEIF
ncbi:alkaline phosphatase [Methylomicrobium sp. Wu6]|uniref:alkaline phosphatase n=1 Tax=Methylomicrobium sp. Wu6 TaxID=3107928 RepID=UPI002DD62F99|nr:alkaline phosphatase [Methylomicrobium sp. Wu6]MEC4747097.1 alkaline phosphatase [Methylomicrobium sp. Wu6]